MEEITSVISLLALCQPSLALAPAPPCVALPSEAGCLLLNLESVWPYHITGTSLIQYRLLSEGQDMETTILSHAGFESNYVFLAECEIE